MHTVIELSIKPAAPLRAALKLAKCVDCVWPVPSAAIS